MQAAGDLVAAAAELAAGVQHGEHDRDGRDALDRVDVDRDAAAVVDDLDAAVLQQRHDDPVAVAGQRLVDGVVDDLPHQVVQAALAGRADVHAGTLADRLEALEDLDRGGVVRRGSVGSGTVGLRAGVGVVSSDTDRPVAAVSIVVDARGTSRAVCTAKVVPLRPLTGNDLSVHVTGSGPERSSASGPGGQCGRFPARRRSARQGVVSPRTRERPQNRSCGVWAGRGVRSARAARRGTRRPKPSDPKSTTRRSGRGRSPPATVRRAPDGSTEQP